MRDAHSWDIGYEAGISGRSMPATPDGGDHDQLAHGYAAGEEAYLASIRREEEAEKRPGWQTALFILLTWAAWVLLAFVVVESIAAFREGGAR